LFPGEICQSGKVNSKIQAEALKNALDIRKFEIDLYWRRAGYFWTFIALTFTSYFIVLQSQSIIDKEYKNELLIILSFLGFFFSLAWFFANKGSKYWQENWEKHVDLLEDNIMGPLYKTTLEYKYSFFDRINPLTSYKYSVGKINQLVSFSIVLLWLYIFCHQLTRLLKINELIVNTNYYIIAIGCGILIFLLCTKTTSSNANGGNFEMRKRNIKQSEKE